MQVSISGFYGWLNRPISQTARENAALLVVIKAASENSKETYGSPRIWSDLRESGFSCSENRVARIMRMNKIFAKIRKRFIITTQSDPALNIAPNALDRQFTVDRPNVRWTTDITYIWTYEGWLYLAVVLDLFSRRVVGWAMSQNIDRALVLSALNMALKQRRPGPGLLCHSDRGSQYASSDYQERLLDAGIECSMSRKGNCWDNATSESFFGSLKRELVHRMSFTTRNQARTAVFEWIEVWYNQQRRHSTLGYLSPAKFELKHQQLKPVTA